MEKLNEMNEKIYNMLCKMSGSYPSKSKKAIVFVSDEREGVIRFWSDTVEMSVTDCRSDEEIFWLHFQAHDENETQMNLNAFFEVLEHGKKESELKAKKLENAAPQHIAIACTTGMTSQLFASMLEDEIHKLGMNYTFDAWAFKDLMHSKNKANKYSLVLLAPQIAFEYKKAKEKFGDNVMVIAPKEFATLDVDKVLYEVSDKFEKDDPKSKNQLENKE